MCNFSDFTRDFLIILLHNRSYPNIEFYGWKIRRKNMFLTDKIARKAFCVCKKKFFVVKKIVVKISPKIQGCPWPEKLYFSVGDQNIRFRLLGTSARGSP